MNIEFKNKIIVFGGDHHNTLGVVRALGEKGIKPFVLLIANPKSKSLVLKSKYINQGNVFNTDAECLQYLKEFYTDKTNKAIVISTSDLATSCLDLAYVTLKYDFFIPNGKSQGNLTNLMDKETMNNLAIELGFHVAEAWLLSDNSNYQDFSYPCITKPLKSIIGSKNDIHIFHTSEELKQFIINRDTNNPIQVQKLIEKEFEYQLIGCSLNGGDEVIIPGYSKILRAASNTNTGFLQYFPISDLEFDKETCLKFIQACNYSGLFSLEFIRSKDGKDYFLEINFRNDGNAYAVTSSGVNLPYIWVLSSLNQDYSLEVNNTVRPITVMPELVDIAQMIRGRISLLQWIKDVNETDCFIYYNKEDKKPFYFQLGYMIRQKIKGFFQKIFRR